jgi:hypothetical protein
MGETWGFGNASARVAALPVLTPGESAPLFALSLVGGALRRGRVEGLRADLTDNPDEWENPTLDRFLEAMAAWVAASDNYYRNTGRPYPDNVSWRLFAEVLAAARSYE